MDGSSDGKCSLAREVETWFPAEDTGELCALGKDRPALLRLSILPHPGHVPQHAQASLLHSAHSWTGTGRSLFYTPASAVLLQAQRKTARQRWGKMRVIIS